MGEWQPPKQGEFAWRAYRGVTMAITPWGLVRRVV